MQEVSRPAQEVLPENALIPAKNIIDPVPNHFTHQLSARENYYFDAPAGDKQPDGFFVEGTKVLLVNKTDKFCWVIGPQGVYVLMSPGSLVPV
ncbi:MAG: hypothetical protein ABIQ31_08725 [Ferruginibacter sp.]